ncbi:MAG TPA: hypothetical protein VEI57_13385 [Nitrospirota bacterium]|nr:hypothetical protein [Nitrospirota bacterium]
MVPKIIKEALIKLKPNNLSAVKNTCNAKAGWGLSNSAMDYDKNYSQANL